MTTRRPTPADPTPDITAEDCTPSALTRSLPPDLGPEAIAVLEGSTFMFSSANGDVPRGSIGGLVHHDTRFISRWELTVNGAPLSVLRPFTVDHYSAAFYLTNPELPGLPANTLGGRRLRFVGDGLHERIELRALPGRPVSVQVRLAVGVDFADILEIKETVRDRSAEIARSHRTDGSGLEFSYRNRGFAATTEVRADPAATRLEGDDLVWDLHLPPGSEWQCEIVVPLHYGPTELQPVHRTFGEVTTGGGDATSRWYSAAPMLSADSHDLQEAFARSVRDLVALRIEKHLQDDLLLLPAAGLPWFLTIFGRDTLLTAYQTMSFGDKLARGALVELAAHQGDTVDAFRDEEPGKILHEIRSGELAVLGERPHNPYYGTADATQLWLILLSEYWRWTLDHDFVRGLRENLHAALGWIAEYGDRDGDGYVEYGTRSPHGLGNQCWRDSWDGVQFADGSMPLLPIATCEVQGYTYDAKLRVAELADGPLGEPALARKLREEAAELRQRFNQDFWIDERGGYYAIGLDGDKRRIDSMTSNMGHLLWSGIVPPERAATVAHQLMSTRLFSGWGVRTTSTADRGYNPIGYHMGTVWPHDNSLIAYGLARYGFRTEANRIALAMLEAAKCFDYRLPEAISGVEREFSQVPVPYPTACSPQAWATGAPLLLLRTMLGLEADKGQVTLNPAIPTEIGHIKLTGTYAFGKRWDIEANGRQGYARLTA